MKKNIIFTFLGIFAVCGLGIVACGEAKQEPQQVQTQVQKTADELVLKNEPNVSIHSIKNGSLPVNGTLTSQSGFLKKRDGQWQAEVVLDMMSWNTELTLRDQRIRDIVLQVSQPAFQTAKVAFAGVDDATFQKIKAGEITDWPVEASLTFLGQTKTVRTKVKLSYDEVNESLQVASQMPVTLSLQTWGLQDEKEALIKACAHQSIDDEVTVEFKFLFQ